jgi:Amt family ammonium transporter
VRSSCLHVPLLDKLKIDDVVGAIPVHLFAGIWGTFIVPLSNPDVLRHPDRSVSCLRHVHLRGPSGIVWFILKAAMGIRVSPEEEMMGLDKSKLVLGCLSASKPIRNSG